MTQSTHFLIALFIIAIAWHCLFNKPFLNKKDIRKWQEFWDRFFE